MDRNSDTAYRELTDLDTVINDTAEAVETALRRTEAGISPEETGTVISVDRGVASVTGLPGLQAEEVVEFPGSARGMVFNLDPEQADIILLDSGERLRAGQEVRRTQRGMDIPVGEELIGRVIDAAGRVLDQGLPLRTDNRLPVERDAPAIMDRSPVTTPLQTGLQVIDALIPIGRGQRELILGDRQTGKTAIALDTIINQKNADVICIYCAIGKRSSEVARILSDLSEHEAMGYSILVAATGEDTPGLNFITPYAACSIGEWFMERGRDVLVVYDDLTKHARAYRELSLLLRRPPSREAYPGDIFYIHSRLLERSTHLDEENGGGSLTALPVIETQAENISAYIPTNLISITDGQIYLSPGLFQDGVLPAVDVGKSVSRVGGKTQLPAYREVSGDLRISYSQFGELETFARFGTRLDEKTKHTLERGRRVRTILKQQQYRPLPVLEQIAVLLAVTEGIFDDIDIEQVPQAAERIRGAAREHLGSIGEKILAGEELTTDEDAEEILGVCRQACLYGARGQAAELKDEEEHGNS